MTRRTRILLCLVWAAFLIRGAFYSTFLPLWEGWDEYPHFAVVQHIQTHRTLPAASDRMSAEISRSLELAPLAFGIGYPPAGSMTHDAFWLLAPEERAERAKALRELSPELQAQPGPDGMYEAKQPPLYYVLAATVLRPFAKTSLLTRAYLARLFSVFVASAAVFLVFACARRFFGDENSALQAAALVTAMPQLFMNVSRSSNEPVSILLYSLLTYLLLRAMRGDISALLLSEVTLALGFLTKAYFVAAVPAVLFVVLVALWRERKGSWRRLAAKVFICGILSLGACGWWYVRNLASSEGPIWDDAAPVVGQTGTGLLTSLVAMDWPSAMDFTMGSHVWLSGWSVLGLRSWIYHVFRAWYIVGIVGLLVYFVRPQRSSSIGKDGARVAAFLYFGFWAALLYHAFVSFTRLRPPASGGWYLFAAIVPEVLVVITGLWQFVPSRWRHVMLTAATGAFALLDLYATHFLSIPYYAGIVQHVGNDVKAFYISDATALGWSEILARLTINKPEFITPWLFVLLWATFLAVTVSVPFLSRMAYSRTLRG